MKKVGKVGAFILIIMAISMVYLFNKYTEADQNISDAETELRMSARSLLASYETNKDLANTNFIEKVIEVEGVVNKITFLNNRYTVFLEGDNNQFAYLICDMQPDQHKKIVKVKPGQTIRLKGVFKGFLKDAILLNCILLNDNHQ